MDSRLFAKARELIAHGPEDRPEKIEAISRASKHTSTAATALPCAKEPDVFHLNGSLPKDAM